MFVSGTNVTFVKKYYTETVEKVGIMALTVSSVNEMWLQALLTVSVATRGLRHVRIPSSERWQIRAVSPDIRKTLVFTME